MNGTFTKGYEQICKFKLDRRKLGSEADLVRLLKRAAEKDGFGILGEISHTYPEGALFAAIPLSESHIMLCVDSDGIGHYELSSCRREEDGKKAFAYLRKELEIEPSDIKETKVPLLEEAVASVPTARTYKDDAINSEVSAMLFGVNPSILENNTLLDAYLRGIVGEPVTKKTMHSFIPKGLTDLCLKDGKFVASHSYPENSSLYVRLANLIGLGVKYHFDALLRKINPERAVLLEARAIKEPSLVH